ncbi:MAG: hypothetical protein AAFQ50_09815, partial [Pseudomonadota bacterium]
MKPWPRPQLGLPLAKVERAQDLAKGGADRNAPFTAPKIDGGDPRKCPGGRSRGMQRRFVIAMAPIGTPDLIVLDEPTSALDPVVAAATMDPLGRPVSGADIATTLITHDLGWARLRVGEFVIVGPGFA